MHVLVCFLFSPSIPDGYTWLKGGSGVPYRQIVYVGLSLISVQDGKHLYSPRCQTSPSITVTSVSLITSNESDLNDGWWWWVPSARTETDREWSSTRMQWKIPRRSLDRTVREEGEDLGLERTGNMAAGWVLVGFQGRSRWFGAETARCSSSLITALLKDKARHALRVLLCMCAAVENAHSFTHVNVMNTAASLSKGFVLFEEIPSSKRARWL